MPMPVKITLELSAVPHVSTYTHRVIQLARYVHDS